MIPGFVVGGIDFGLVMTPHPRKYDNTKLILLSAHPSYCTIIITVTTMMMMMTIVIIVITTLETRGLAYHRRRGRIIADRECEPSGVPGVRVKNINYFLFSIRDTRASLSIVCGPACVPDYREYV